MHNQKNYFIPFVSLWTVFITTIMWWYQLLLTTVPFRQLGGGTKTFGSFMPSVNAEKLNVSAIFTIHSKKRIDNYYYQNVKYKILFNIIFHIANTFITYFIVSRWYDNNTRYTEYLSLQTGVLQFNSRIV